MSTLLFLSLFLSIFALVVGVPRALSRRRPDPEQGLFEGLIDDLEAVDTRAPVDVRRRA